MLCVNNLPRESGPRVWGAGSSHENERTCDVETLAEQLRLIGLNDHQARTYAQLLESAPASAADLTAATGLDRSESDEALAFLVDNALARREDDRFTPVSPEAALNLMSLQREADLRRVRERTMDAFAAFQRAAGEPTQGLLEVVTGDEVPARVEQLARTARSEIRATDSPPYALGQVAPPRELEMLADGIKHRIVYSRASLDVPGYLDNAILPCVEAGEQARVLPAVPVKMAVIDRSVGFVSLTIAEADAARSLLVIQPCSLLTALEGLFEMCWEAALPLKLAARGEQPGAAWIEPADRRLLGYLAAGIPDEAIASNLSMSRRTFFRHLEQLMARTGSESRFQLALHAQRNGWL